MPNDTQAPQQFNTSATLAGAIAKALGAPDPEETGDGYLTFCPVHESNWREHNPSLMVFDTLHCHCRTGGEACKGAMAGSLRTLGILVRPPQATDYPWTEERRHAWVSGCGQFELEHIKEVAHRNQAERGNFRAVHVGDKRFRWVARPTGSSTRMQTTRRWEGTDQSLFDMHPEARPTLYKAAELDLERGIPCLLLVEGEKDADAALSLGVPATCTYQGAGQKLTGAQLELLLKAELLVVCGDHDDAGEHYVRHVAAVLRARGKQCYHLALDYEQDREDLSDWLWRQDAPGVALLGALDRCLPAPEGGDDDGVATAWTEGLTRGRGGALVASSRNWELVLGNDRHIAPRLRFNVRVRQPEYFDEREGKWRTGVDGVSLVIKRAFDLYGNGTPVPGKGVCAQLVQDTRPHHDEYSDRLAELPQWDGQERVKNLFGKYLGCGGSDAYLELVSITHFTGQMARILEPGAKHDYMPILLGPQGLFKSTGLRELCLIPSAFMEVPIPDRLDKAFTRNLVGNELVEIPEGQTLFANKVRTDTAKGWASIRIDTLDMKYLNADSYPRTWVGVITANEDAGRLLTALSGHRKFPIVRAVRHADIAGIREDFEQLWAECLHLVLNGIRDKINYYGMEHMGEEIARSHVQFDENLVEEIERYLTHNWDRMTGGPETEWVPRETARDRVFARDIYPALFGMDGVHVPRPRQIEMHRILRHLGYKEWQGRARQQDVEDSPGKLKKGQKYRGWEFSDGLLRRTPKVLPTCTPPLKGSAEQGGRSENGGPTGLLGVHDDRRGQSGDHPSNKPSTKANPKVDTTSTIELIEVNVIGRESSAEVVYTCQTPADLQTLLSQHSVESVLGLDVETDTSGRLRLVQVSDGSTTVVVDVREHSDVPRLLTGRRFAAHNAAFEAEKLAAVGVYPELDCTLIAHRVLTAEVKDDDKKIRKHDLATCVREEGGPPLDKRFQAAENWDGDLSEAHLDYAAQDAVWAAKLWELYEARLREQEMFDGYRLIASCVRPAADMHRTGFHLDREGHARLVAKYRTDALAALKDYADVPWTRLCLHSSPSKTVRKSWPELGEEWLQLVAGLQSGKIMTEGLVQVLPKDVRINWRRGGAKKDLLVLDRRYVKRHLKWLRDPEANPEVRDQMREVADLLEHRARFIKCTKLLSAFGDSLVERADADGRLHGEFNLARAATGRMCVHPRTEVLTSAGLGAIEDVPVGALIQTHTGGWRRVVRHFVKPVEMMYRYACEDGSSIVCTKGHRVLTPSGWQFAGTLEVGSHVSVEAVSLGQVVSGSCGSPVLSGGQTDHAPGSGADGDNGAQRAGRSARACPARGSDSRTELAGSAGEVWQQEPDALADRREASQLQGGLLRPQGLFDGHSPGVVRVEEQEGVPAPCGDGAGSWSTEDSAGLGRASYRQERGEQRSGESRVGDQLGAPEDSRRTARIARIDIVGEAPVHDVEVEGDHSYVAGGLIHHNSCTSPNLQQMPNANDFRNLFTAPPGRVLVVGDYTQIEVRVAGLLAQEPKIAEFFRSGYDVHKASAALMYRVPYEEVDKGQRKKAKAITFGILYGMGAESLADQLGCDKAGAEEQLLIWEQAFPVLSAWREQEAEDAKKRGYVLMGDGRRVKCDRNSRPAQLYNYPVQGTAASCQYAALAWLWEAFQVFGVDAAVVAVVHDEMVVECAESAMEEATDLLREAMAHGMRAVFGTDVELSHLCGIAAGTDWSEKE